MGRGTTGGWLASSAPSWGRGEIRGGTSQGKGLHEVGQLAPPSDPTSSLATLGVIATSHSGHYSIPVTGFSYT